MSLNAYIFLLVAILVFVLIHKIADKQEAENGRKAEYDNMKMWRAVSTSAVVIAGALVFVLFVAIGETLFTLLSMLLPIDSVEVIHNLKTLGVIFGLGMAGGFLFSLHDITNTRDYFGATLFFIRNTFVGGIIAVLFIIILSVLMGIALLVAAMVIAVPSTSWVYVVGLAILFLALVITFYDY